MSYKEKPILKLYKYENNTFVLQAIIDDFMECSFERNLYQAGNFTISINYNIPNAQLFQRGLFVQFGNDPYDFGEIISISDAISSDGKGSQVRTITGYDSRYILKRRVIKNMNSNGLWVMTGKGETVLRNLINDQCGAGESETKRQLPIINSIPDPANAIGKEYSVSEQFSNLYEVCKTIATQSEIGWRLKFDNSSLTLTLECYEGENRAQTVQFSTSFDSLADGQFTDSSDSYTNAIYVGGKGQNDDRDIYEGEDGTPSGLDRFESWDNQSNMTTEDEYEAEALAMLTQYGQTITVNGNGLAKCPYIYKEEYDVGDIITLAFSGKSAIVQILSVTEHWAFGQYSINFSFGKPQNNIQDQLQLILRKIQTASEKSESTDSVRWYTIPDDSQMPKADVTYRTIGFIGNVGSGATFKLYLDNEKTGAKTYHIYFKQLAGVGKLTLTTGKEGASNLILNSGTYVAIVYVDTLGNVTMAGATATDIIAEGNNQPVTSDGVNTIVNELETEISGKQNTLTAGANIKIDNNVIEGTSDLPTDAVLHYSFDELPDYPDGEAIARNLNGDTYNVAVSSAGTITTDAYAEDGKIHKSNVNGNANYKTNVGSNRNLGVYFGVTSGTGLVKIIEFNAKTPNLDVHIFYRQTSSSQRETIYPLGHSIPIGKHRIVVFVPQNCFEYSIVFYSYNSDLNYTEWELTGYYLGNGSYSTPVIDNANGKYQTTQTKGFTTLQGVSGKGVYFPTFTSGETKFYRPAHNTSKDLSISFWVKFTEANTTGILGLITNSAFQTAFGIGRQNNNNEISIISVVRTPNKSTTISSIVEVNKWIHCSVIFIGNNKMKMYINGVLKATSGSIDNNYQYSQSQWIINRNSAFWGQNLTGDNFPLYLDDILFFDRALTETEVKALYNNKANTPKYYNLNNYKLPAPPTTDGSYTLNVTVSGGVPSYSWS